MTAPRVWPAGQVRMDEQGQVVAVASDTPGLWLTVEAADLGPVVVDDVVEEWVVVDASEVEAVTPPACGRRGRRGLRVLAGGAVSG